MKHDEKWLDENTHVDGHDAKCDFEDAKDNAREYAEHMDRWRPITERPDIGSFVAMINPDDKILHPLIAKWTYLKDSCADMGNYDGWQWNPVTMPESGA